MYIFTASLQPCSFTVSMKTRLTHALTVVNILVALAAPNGIRNTACMINLYFRKLNLTWGNSLETLIYFHTLVSFFHTYPELEMTKNQFHTFPYCIGTL